jgi:glycosyltransferase involved in cell wall biosynthesis
MVVANSAATAAAAGLTGRAAVVHDGAVAPRGTVKPYRGGRLKALMAGRMASWKGQDVAIAAVREARRQGHDIQLTLAGAALFPDDQAFEADLRRENTDGIAEGWLTFAGFVEDMAPVYTSHQVAIHASRLPEPFGQVLVEAMSYGLPVIASRGGGPSEILTGGLADLLVAPGEAEPIAELLMRLANVDAWNSYSTEALKHGTAFSVGATATRLVEVFREIR